MKKEKKIIVSALAFALAFGAATTETLAFSGGFEPGFEDGGEEANTQSVEDKLKAKYLSMNIAYGDFKESTDVKRVEISDNDTAKQNSYGYNIPGNNQLETGYEVGIRGFKGGITWTVSVNDEEKTYELTKPQETIIRVGNKPLDINNMEDHISPQLYNEYAQEDPSLKLGEIKTIQEGQNGLMRVKYGIFNNRAEAEAWVKQSSQTFEPGKQEFVKDENGIIEPSITITPPGCKPEDINVDDIKNYPYKYFKSCEYDIGTGNQKLIQKIVAVGTKVAEEVEVTKIPFETERRKNNNLKPGEEKVIQRGEEGEKQKVWSIDVHMEIHEGKETTVKEPVKEIIEYGVETEEIPYKTTYVYDEDEEIGYEEKTTEGKVGKKEKDTEIIIEKPIDEVITIGVKPKITVTEKELDYKVIREEDPTLNVGEEKIEQKGKKGKETTTITETYNKETKEIESNTETKREEPVDEIIKVGTKVVNKIPYDTIYKEDPNKEIGTPDEIEEGEDGEETNGKITKEKKDKVITIGTKPIEKEIPYETKRVFKEDMLESEGDVIHQKGEKGLERTTLEIVDNKVRPEPKTKIVKEPVDEIIYYGNKKQKEEETPFKTIRKFNKELKQNEEEIIQEGKVGINLITYYEEDGKEVITNTEEKSKPIDRIIEYGPTDIKEKVEEIDFNTIKKEDNTLEKGKTKVIQEGEKGKIVISYTIVDGKEIELSKTITDPVDEIILIGTKVVEEIPFETIYKEDPDKEIGTPDKVEEGEKGEKTNGKITKEKKDKVITIGTKPIEKEIPYETKRVFKEDMLESEGDVIHQKGEKGLERTTLEIVDNKVRPEPKTERIKEPVEEIIYYGNKKQKEEEIPFEIEKRFNKDLKKDEIKVIQEGKVGINLITYYEEDGKEVITNTEEKSKPIDRIIEYGPTDIKEKVEEIDFNTIKKEDNTLEKGKTKVIQEGEKGKIVISYTIVDGKEIELSKTETKPKDKIILIGTKVVEEIPFETIYKEDPNKEIGTPDEIEEGEDGEETNGKITKEKKDKVITIGTKPIEKEIPYETKRVFKEDMLESEGDVVHQKGEKGLERTTLEIVDNKVRPEPKTEIVKEPVEEIIYYGNKKQKEEEIPFGIEKRFNKDLKKDEIKVIQEGKVGINLITYYEEDGKEIITKKEIKTEPVKKIIEYGPTDIKQKEEKIPFEIIVEYDENLENGKEVIKQKGKEGKIVIEYTIIEGKEIELSKTITDPVDEIKVVGRKKVETKEVEIPFKTIRKENKDLYEGYERLITKGEKGIEKKTIINGKEEKSEIIKNKIDEVIEYGTKPIPKNDKVEEEKIPYEIIYKDDDTLKFGERKVVQEGKEGLIRQTFKYVLKEDGSLEEVKDEKVIVKEKKDKIVLIGKAIPENKRVDKKELDFKVIYREDRNLKKGEEKVLKEGEKGIEVTTFKYIIDENGKLKEVVDKITVEKQPIDKIILKGIKEDQPVVNRTEEVNRAKEKRKDVKTGVDSIAGVMAILSAASVAYLSSKKKDK